MNFKSSKCCKRNKHILQLNVKSILGILERQFPQYKKKYIWIVTGS